MLGREGGHGRTAATRWGLEMLTLQGCCLLQAWRQLQQHGSVPAPSPGATHVSRVLSWHSHIGFRTQLISAQHLVPSECTLSCWFGLCISISVSFPSSGCCWDAVSIWTGAFWVFLSLATCISPNGPQCTDPLSSQQPTQTQGRAWLGSSQPCSCIFAVLAELRNPADMQDYGLERRNNPLSQLCPPFQTQAVAQGPLSCVILHDEQTPSVPQHYCPVCLTKGLSSPLQSKEIQLGAGKGEVIQCWNNYSWLDSKWTLYFLLKSTQKAEQEEAGISPRLEARAEERAVERLFPILYYLGQAHNCSVPQFPLRLQDYLLASSIFCKDFSVNPSEMAGGPHEEDMKKVHITVKNSLLKTSVMELRKLKGGTVLFK